MNWQKQLFRSSCASKIMTEPRSGSGLSETCKTYCKELFIEQRYGRKKEVTTKYMEKGILVEEDSLTLYSRYKKEFLKKNTERLTNEFISGHPDTIKPLIDFKSSWDIFTFLNNRFDKFSKDYYWQLQGYMALTDEKTSRLVFCLINTPETLINDEKRKLMYKMNIISDHDSDFEKACEEMDKAMRFDDIPMEERIIEFQIDRNQEDIDNLYKRVKRCRYYLEELEESFAPNGIIVKRDEEVKTTIIDPLTVPLKKIS